MESSKRSRLPDPDRTRRLVGLVLYLLGTLSGAALLVVVFLLPPLFTENPIAVYGAVLLGAALALPAAAMYLTVPRLLDRYDPEPWYALVGSFLWGALAAGGVSALINSLNTALVGSLAGPDAGELFGTVVSAPLVEETTKGLGVFGVYVFLRREFDGVVDGIIYATFVALGFAAAENIVYYSEAAMSGVDVLATTMIGRGIISPWVHPVFTAMTGVGLGIARETESNWLRSLAPGVGLAMACVLHAIWNGSLALSGVLAIVMLPLWFLFVLGFLVLVIVLVVRRGRTIRAQLLDEVAIGTIDETELQLVCSPFGVLRARLSYGKDGEEFVRAVARLALSKWHTTRAVRGKNVTISMQFIAPLRKRIHELKQLRSRKRT